MVVGLESKFVVDLCGFLVMVADTLRLGEQRGEHDVGKDDPTCELFRLSGDQE